METAVADSPTKAIRPDSEDGVSGNNTDSTAVSGGRQGDEVDHADARGNGVEAAQPAAVPDQAAALRAAVIAKAIERLESLDTPTLACFAADLECNPPRGARSRTPAGSGATRRDSVATETPSDGRGDERGGDLLPAGVLREVRERAIGRIGDLLRNHSDIFVSALEERLRDIPLDRPVIEDAEPEDSGEEAGDEHDDDTPDLNFIYPKHVSICCSDDRGETLAEFGLVTRGERLPDLFRQIRRMVSDLIVEYGRDLGADTMGGGDQDEDISTRDATSSEAFDPDSVRARPMLLVVKADDDDEQVVACDPIVLRDQVDEFARDIRRVVSRYADSYAKRCKAAATGGRSRENGGRDEDAVANTHAGVAADPT